MRGSAPRLHTSSQAPQVTQQADLTAELAARVRDVAELDGRHGLDYEPSSERPTRLATWSAKCLLLDASALAIAPVLNLIGAKWAGIDSLPASWMVALAVTALVLYGARGAYASRLVLDVVEDARLIVTQTALATVVILAARAVSERETISLGAAVSTWLLL